ncbi:hypothetical protein [Pseudomonas phage Astolliot]|nr:hypothetical protein [Pseudomonas phage Astolliot]
MFPVNLTHRILPQGRVGAIRKYDIHTGLDLYCEMHADVRAMQPGTVVDVFQFTGEAVGSSWWNRTYAVVVESGDLTYVYGELIPRVEIGQKVINSDLLGWVTPVLKTDKGVTPTSMLHLELWETKHYIKNHTWGLTETMATGLLDPLIKMPHWLIKTEHGWILEDCSGHIVQFFDMACNSKAWCMEKNIVPIYLTPKTDPAKIRIYTTCTGKVPWFIGIHDGTQI